ncbi:MAG TPA: hypothetical protein PLE54_09705 [Burkholderiaceae bacterium]|nr:hypothetical protein [Burkholderiaceae bacterium]HQR70865.1 hypothetical protein [Burkholderiaceae bacterium]
MVGSGTAANDVLGGSNGITKAAMGLMKSGNDLVVDCGSGDAVTLRNWYAWVRNVGTLKIIGDAAWVPGQTGPPAVVETLSLVTLATQFDAARTADPLLTRWPLSSASITLVSRTGAVSEDSAFSALSSAPLAARPRLPSKGLLLRPAGEPSDALLESRSLRNMRAMHNLWAPTGPPSKAASWLTAAAEATMSPAQDSVSMGDVMFEPVGIEPVTKKWAATKCALAIADTGEIASCEDALETGVECEPIKPDSSEGPGPWWADPAITRTLTPMARNTAPMTGWNPVADPATALPARATEAAMPAPFADSAQPALQMTARMDLLNMPWTGLVSEWERRSALH